MNHGESFRHILNVKLGQRSTKNETNFKNFDSTLFESAPHPHKITVFTFRNSSFSAYSKTNKFGDSQSFHSQGQSNDARKPSDSSVSEPFPTQEEHQVSLSELNPSETVAFKTLSGLSSVLAQNTDCFSLRDITKAKRQLSKKLHPDMGGNTEQFMAVIEACMVLESLFKTSEKTSEKASEKTAA